MARHETRDLLQVVGVDGQLELPDEVGVFGELACGFFGVGEIDTTLLSGSCQLRQGFSPALGVEGGDSRAARCGMPEATSGATANRQRASGSHARESFIVRSSGVRIRRMRSTR